MVFTRTIKDIKGHISNVETYKIIVILRKFIPAKFIVEYSFLK